MKRTLVLAAVLLVAAPLAIAAPNSSRNNNTMTGARPSATYTAATTGRSTAPETLRSPQQTQRPVHVRQEASSSTRFRFTEVPPRSLY